MKTRLAAFLVALLLAAAAVGAAVPWAVYAVVAWRVWPISEDGQILIRIAMLFWAVTFGWLMLSIICKALVKEKPTE